MDNEEDAMTRPKDIKEREMCREEAGGQEPQENERDG
jgi:hypothetical protein